MLLDDFLPDHDFREYHQALVAAPAARVWEAVQELDMRRSPLVGGLMLLRELPWRLTAPGRPGGGPARTLDQMLAFGFILLAADPPRELALGLVGRFWSPRPRLLRLSPQGFMEFSQPGLAKVAANFLVEPLGPSLCRLSTETRVQCLGPLARSRFRAYWTLIRPFSGLIRREWLRLARRQAEAGSERSLP